MASIHKRGDGWVVRWREGGRNRQRTLPTLRAARQLQREIQECRALGRRWEPQDSPAPDLVAAFGAYLEEMRVTKAAATVANTHAALDMYLRCLEALGASRHGELTPECLTRSSLASFAAWIRDVRQGSPLTAQQYVRTVERAWRWLYDSDAFGDHMPRPRRLDMAPASPEVSPVAPTWADMDAAIAAAWEAAARPSSRGAEWVPRLWTLLRFTGLRRSQALQLEWRDIDLDQARMTIRPELGKSRRERRGRVVPLAPPLVEILAGWGVREGRLVEASKKPSWTYAKRHWAAAGVPPERWRQPQHAFRKGFVTGLAELGVHQRTIAALVGHAGGTTTDVYTDPAALMAAMREAVARIPPIGASLVTNELGTARSKRTRTSS